MGGSPENLHKAGTRRSIQFHAVRTEIKFDPQLCKVPIVPGTGEGASVCT